MKNPLVKILGIILLSFVALFLARDVIAKAMIGKKFHAATGLSLTIGQFHTGASLSFFEVKNLKLFNPAGFSEKVMFHVPEVYANYDLATLFSGRPHIRKIKLHLTTLEIERNKAGELNIDKLKPASKRNEAATGKKPASVKVQIDELQLRIDKVVYKDFSKPIAVHREFNVNIDKTYSNITDVRALTPLVVSDALKSTGLGTLLGIGMSDLLNNFSASGIDVGELGLNQISSSGLGQTAQGVVSSVADQIGSLFGGNSQKK